MRDESLIAILFLDDLGLNIAPTLSQFYFKFYFTILFSVTNWL